MPNRCPILSSWSSRATRGICFFFCLGLLYPVAAVANDAPTRPGILGISYVTTSVSDICKARDFYSGLVSRPLRCLKNERARGGVVPISSSQFIALSKEPPVGGTNAVLRVVFLTENVKKLREYLRASGIQTNSEGVPSKTYLTIIDPEGHRLSFLQKGPQGHPLSPGPIDLRIIHAGFIVHDRAAMEHFYKDILGFRPYWHGGMKDDETSWVSLQVPDGTDWLEFMLYDDSKADQRFRGIMNHIALGVTDIHAAQEQLRKNGAPLTEEPKIGRDGKWQLNLYDPDLTRIEFMEFTPKEKPCCSEFTAPHPKP